MYNNFYRRIRGGNSVVECFLAKEDVASSSLVSRSKKESAKDSFLLCTLFASLARLERAKLMRTSRLRRKSTVVPLK